MGHNMLKGFHTTLRTEAHIDSVSQWSVGKLERASNQAPIARRSGSSINILSMTPQVDKWKWGNSNLIPFGVNLMGAPVVMYNIYPR